MLFSILLLSCMTHSRTLKEGKAKVSVETARADPGEIYLFFDTLEHPGSRSPLRLVPSGYDGPLCDGIVLYAKKGYEKKIICLVELKTGKPNGAEQQIVCTKKFLEKYIPKDQLSTIDWRAHIHIFGCSPRDIRGMEKELGKEFEKGHFTITNKENLYDILHCD